MKSAIRPILACTVIGIVGVPAFAFAEPPAAPMAESESSAALVRSPHGLVELIGEAISDVTLTPEQEEKVEMLSKEIEPLQTLVDEAEDGLLTMLADQVETGRIDRTELEPYIETYVNARVRVAPEIRRAFEELHDLMTMEQRTDFADSLECGLYDAHRAIMSGEQIDEFAKKMELNPTQIAQMEEGLRLIHPSLQIQRAHLHRLVEAFRDPEFSVEDVYPYHEVAMHARQRAHRILHLTARLLDVLEPAQRRMLAERMRDASHVQPETSSKAGALDMPQDADEVGVATQPMWVGAVRRGPFGGIRRAGVFVSPFARYSFGRVYAFPYAAGWGYGW